MNIHKIDSRLHQSFLEEERKDSITGDLIKANDEVVFCAICKSAFQKDSWEYMNRKHCGQTKTLNSIPISKPLLLNVSIIKPHFITLVNTSISFDKCLTVLSDFNPRDKKVEIRLDPILRKGTEQYKKLVEKTKEIVEIKKPIKKEEKEEQWEKDVIQGVIIFVVLMFITAFPLSAILEKTALSKFFFVLFCGLIASLFVMANKYNFFKRKKITHNKKEESDNSITFGIFNHSLFFYFEQLKQGVFIELTRINDLEIQYQSSCCVNLILKKQDSKSEEVSIPLIFSKKERITTFLLRLAKTKKNSANHTEVKLTNFPIERIRLLKRKLLLYVDFKFIEPKKIESKEPEYKKIFSSQDKTIINSINQEINPRDLSKLEKSQKVSKQSKNRNQHHQNKHQIQYRNYKRK